MYQQQEFLKINSKVIEEIGCEECYDSNQIWKADSTLYEPEEQDAGCYYEIATDNNDCFMLTWYCGC